MIGLLHILVVLLMVAAGLFGQPAFQTALLPSSALVSSTAADESGAIFLGGTVVLGNLPTTPGVLQPNAPSDCTSQSNCQHGFIAKIAPGGTAISWATYLAGDGVDRISALALTSDGQIVVAGETTSTNLLPALGGYRTTPSHLFVAKLSTDATHLTASTYFGGLGNDVIAALKLDMAGNVYVAGSTESTDFPTTAGAYQRSLGSGPAPPGFATCSNSCSDQFLSKLDPALAHLAFSTLVGTSIEETTADLALGPDGTLYLSGTRGPALAQGPGPTVPIVVRLTQDASAVIYSVEVSAAFPGGGPLIVDAGGNAYVATYNPRWQITGPDSVTWKLNPQGVALLRQAIHGTVTSMALNAQGEIVVAGMTYTFGLSTTPGAPRLCLSSLGSRPLSAYVARWNTSSGALTYAGSLNANEASLVHPDQVVADSAYVGLPQYSLLPAGNPPAGTVTCIANAASYDNTALAPGEIMTIFGTAIGPDREFTAELDPSGRVSSELGGVTVSIGGLPAPILYAAPGQINLVGPFGTSVDGSVPVEIRRGGSLVTGFHRPVAAVHPGLFTTDGAIGGPLAALNEDGSVNTPSNPAAAGSIVSVFATGMGAMLPPALDGTIPPGPVAKPVADFFVRINGLQLAALTYLGNAPGLIQGAIQINFRLPAGAVSSNGTVGVTVGPNGPTTSCTLAVR